MPNETNRLSLTEAHRDAIKAANSSWSETDKLYVSVCAALISLTAIFGWDKSGSRIWMGISSFILMCLAINWLILIYHYRDQIRYSLRALSKGQECPEFFGDEYKRVNGYWNDYFIAVVVLLMAVSMLVMVILSRFTNALDWLNKAAS
jgi:hypothetical protein